MPDSPVRIILIGVGGFGRYYCDGLLEGPAREMGQVVAAVDPHWEKAKKLEKLQELEIPLFKSLEDVPEDLHPELALISTPTYTHEPLALACLERGCHVLCEKPLAATVQEGRAMLEAAKKAGRFLDIGYQWSHSIAIHRLKADIAAGRFGKPLRMKTIALWPRPDVYFERPWAGMSQHPSGRWVLDSPYNNATSHYFHNMLYLLGGQPDRSAEPVSVQAELFRGRDIANSDTGAIRVWTADDVEVLFYTSHSVCEGVGPNSVFEFTDATIEYDFNVDVFVARMRNGEIIEYPYEGDNHRKITLAIEAVRQEGQPICPVEAALPHTICVNGAQESAEEIVTFSGSDIETLEVQDKCFHYVRGLGDAFVSAWENWKLPSENGWAKARPGRIIDLRGYSHFPSSGQAAI